MQIAPKAPGITMPGWKSSNARPTIPARKSRLTMFGSIRVDRKLVKKPGETLTISAPFVCSVKWRGTVVRPSIWRAAPAGSATTRSITC